jgi:hypothetical protein
MCRGEAAKKEGRMVRAAVLCGAIGVLAIAVDGMNARAITLAITMTNDPALNEIQVYDATTNTLVQTLSTLGKGGVAGNARGVREYNGELFAAVNNGSNTVALFRRVGIGLQFDKLVTTTSAPVSIDSPQTRAAIRLVG